MNRREALVLMGTLCGGTIFGAHRLLARGIANGLEGSATFVLSPADLALLAEVADTIIPTTPDSGGAKSARVEDFMQEIVRDFYSPEEQAVFSNGLREFETLCRNDAGQSFVNLLPAQRETVLSGLEKSTPVPAYYQMIKQLTLWGYFSSEIGATQALAHVAVPGRYEGCMTIPPGTRAWSE